MLLSLYELPPVVDIDAPLPQRSDALALQVIIGIRPPVIPDIL